MNAFEECATGRLFYTVDQMNLRLFEEFQAAREVTPKTMAKEFQHLTSFCARQLELNWLATNFTKKVALPKADGVSTLPFNEAEAKAILRAAPAWGRPNQGAAAMLPIPPSRSMKSAATRRRWCWSCSPPAAHFGYGEFGPPRDLH